jgi:hypothetical protein
MRIGVKIIDVYLTFVFMFLFWNYFRKWVLYTRLRSPTGHCKLVEKHEQMSISPVGANLIPFVNSVGTQYTRFIFSRFRYALFYFNATGSISVLSAATAEAAAHDQWVARAVSPSFTLCRIISWLFSTLNKVRSVSFLFYEFSTYAVFFRDEIPTYNMWHLYLYCLRSSLLETAISVPPPTMA